MNHEVAAGPEVAEAGGVPADLILASTSEYRRQLLGRLGVAFRCVAPAFDEATVTEIGRSPREVAELRALGKAEDVSARHPGSVVIGSDQLVSLDGAIHGKPGSPSRCREQLEILSGRSHDLITAMVVIAPGRCLRWTDVTRLHMRALHADQIARYVEQEKPLDCAGSYKLEALGIALFERIESADQTAIIGLPLMALVRFLAQLGFEIP